MFSASAEGDQTFFKVLIVGNDVDGNTLVRQHLEGAGFRVKVAQSGCEARREINDTSGAPDLVLLDLLLPDMSGLDLCRWVRSGLHTAGLPIFILTAKNTETDKVLSLYAGADDYMTKPFGIAELEARVHALMRRAKLLFEPGTQSVYKCGRLRINFTTYELFINERLCKLEVFEFRLLCFFVQHPMQTFTREQLVRFAWGSHSSAKPRSTDVYIWRLRQAIEPDPAEPKAIVSVRGVGYRFNPNALVEVEAVSEQAANARR